MFSEIKDALIRHAAFTAVRASRLLRETVEALSHCAVRQSFWMPGAIFGLTSIPRWCASTVRISLNHEMPDEQW